MMEFLYGAVETVESVKENNEAVERLNREGNALVLLDISNLIYTTDEAREFIASSEKMKKLYKKEAGFSRTFVGKNNAKYLMKVYKPFFQLEFFDTKVEAINWLKSE